MNTIQRSFAAGELAPALFARADLSRYAIGLRTCRNMVVMRAGGATKRPGTQYVDTAGVASAYLLTMDAEVDVVAGHTANVTAVLTDFMGNVITAFPCTFETDNPAIATIAATGPRSATVTGVSNGTISVRARIAGLGIVSNNCAVVVTDFYVLHAFPAGTNNFNVTTGGIADRVVMIAGGGAGGSVDGTGVGTGGGGAGEFLRLDQTTDTADSTTFMHFTPGLYPISVGAGGQHVAADHSFGGGVFAVMDGNNGNDTTFLGKTVKGGGGGGGNLSASRAGHAGGSGGGGGSCGDGSEGTGGASNITNARGKGNGGAGGVNDSTKGGGGGGGAQFAGDHTSQGVGGAGQSDDITGASIEYARGGDGTGGGNGGTGLGAGGQGQSQGTNHQGGNGGDGIVYVRYKASSGIVATGGTVITFAV